MNEPKDPGYFRDIREAGAKIGIDGDVALDLHHKLCYSDEPGAQFAAELVLRALEHYNKAGAIMSTLATLARQP